MCRGAGGAEGQPAPWRCAGQGRWGHLKEKLQTQGVLGQRWGSHLIGSAQREELPEGESRGVEPPSQLPLGPPQSTEGSGSKGGMRGQGQAGWSSIRSANSGGSSMMRTTRLSGSRPALVEQREPHPKCLARTVPAQTRSASNRDISYCPGICRKFQSENKSKQKR